MQALTPKYEERTGPWIQTYSGRRFYPFEARAEDVNTEDIAHSLSNICRFSGHCTRFYSILEHSLHVAGLVPPELKAYALLHDAPKAFLGEIMGPLKRTFDFALICLAEEELMKLIELRYALPPGPHASVELADKAMLWWEREHLLTHKLPEWEKWKRFADYFPPVVLPHYAPHPEALIETFAKELHTAVGHEVLAGTHLELQPAEDAQ